MLVSIRIHKMHIVAHFTILRYFIIYKQRLGIMKPTSFLNGSQARCMLSSLSLRSSSCLETQI